MQHKRHIKLMIVDDHAETRVLIRELIGHFAEEIRECANGEAAAAECANFHPDLVTMDLNMPLTGGLEATRRILATNPQARVIAITQFDSPEFRLAASRAGACHFFSKNNLTGLLHYLEHQEQLCPSESFSQ
jgi:two-component system invasion response regulator UvrY